RAALRSGVVEISASRAALRSGVVEISASRAALRSGVVEICTYVMHISPLVTRYVRIPVLSRHDRRPGALPRKRTYPNRSAEAAPPEQSATKRFRGSGAAGAERHQTLPRERRRRS